MATKICIDCNQRPVKQQLNRCSSCYERVRIERLGKIGPGKTWNEKVGLPLWAFDILDHLYMAGRSTADLARPDAKHDTAKRLINRLVAAGLVDRVDILTEKANRTQPPRAHFGEDQQRDKTPNESNSTPVYDLAIAGKIVVRLAYQLMLQYDPASSDTETEEEPPDERLQRELAERDQRTNLRRW